MSLKMNFLIIFIIVLTTFVKMVPAPRSNHRFAGYKSDVISGNKIKVQIKNKDLVTKDSLERFADIYKTEISTYVKKHQIINNDENEPDKTATLLYFKDIFNEFNRYNWSNSYGSNVFIHYMTLKNEDSNEEIKENINDFKQIKEKDLRYLYNATTYCLLPNEIEDEFFFEQLRFVYNLNNAKRLVNGEEKATLKNIISELEIPAKHNSSEEIKQYVLKFNLHLNKKDDIYDFLRLYIGDLNKYDPKNFPTSNFDDIRKDDPDNYQGEKLMAVKKYVIDHYVYFSSKWQYYGFDEDTFFQCLLLDKYFQTNINIDNMTMTINDDGDNKSMPLIDAFLHYFKESLDNSYSTSNLLDISKLTEAHQTVYYKQMLRGMISVYHAYNNVGKDAIEKMKDVPAFVKQMINVAESILNSNKNNTVLTGGGHQPEFDSENDGYVVKDICYKYDGQKLALPEKVNFKDVLDYLIVNYIKDTPIEDNNAELNQSEFTLIPALKELKQVKKRTD